MNVTSISEREGGLHRGLSKAQIVMIGLGGAIGTGLFMGSGIAIGSAGPAVDSQLCTGRARSRW